MKYSIISVIISLAVLWGLPPSAASQSLYDYSELNDSETVASMRRHVANIASAANKGRKAGSEGEKTSAGYVYDRLEECGVEMLCDRTGKTFGIASESGDTINSANIVGFVQGYDPELNKRYIVVGARLDNLGTNLMKVDGEDEEQIYYGANGNASGLSMLIELAGRVVTNSILFRRSVIFVAFGASRQGCAGSWYFLNRSFSDTDNIDAMINLDMLGSGEDFYAYTASNMDMNMLLSRLSGTLQPILPKVTAVEPYPSDHRAFYSKEIPSVFFTTGQYAEHDTPADTPSILDFSGMEKELEYIYNFTREVANADSAPEFHRNKKPLTDNKSYSYYDCDHKPSFMGHTDLGWFMRNWVYQYLRYPESAVKAGIQGRVHVQFAVDKDGTVKEAKIVKGVAESLDEEVLRVINASPSWKPGRKNGAKVKCYITLPVDFMLEKKSSRKTGIK